MPVLEKTSLGWIVCFIRHVVQFEKANSMDVYSMALIFAQTFFHNVYCGEAEELASFETKVDLTKMFI